MIAGMQAEAELARRIAHSAGELLVSFRRTSGLRDKPLGKAADRISNDYILRALREARPHDAILSKEEAAAPSRFEAERVWIVDPLDGTREYGEERPDWAVYVGSAVSGVPVAGAVALPGTLRTLYSGAPLRPGPAASPLRILVSQTCPAAEAMEVAGHLGAGLIPMGSAGAKAMAFLLGEGEIYLHSGGQYEWDSCAPVTAALASGLHASRVNREPLRYNSGNPYLPDLLICRRELASAVLDVIRRLQRSSSRWGDSSMNKRALVCLLMGATASSPALMAADATPSTEPSDALAEVVVTAQKREERLEDIPLSVSAVDSRTLSNTNVTNVSDLKVLVPALSAESSLGVVLPFIRGVGNPSLTVGNEASVPVYVDGVYYSRIAPSFFELNDVQRVEVLKGPQGTLFGRNSTGGLIQIITRDPGPGVSANASLSYGNFDTTRSSGYVSAGTDVIAADVAVLYEHQVDGWGVNLTTGDKTYTNRDAAVRSKVVFKPVSGTKLTLALDYTDGRSGQGLAQHAFRGEVQGNLVALGQPLPDIPFYDSRGGFPTYSQARGRGVSLHYDQNLGVVDLVSITAYRKADGIVSIDADFQPTPYYGALEPYDTNQTSEELQILSKPGSPLRWIVGLYYLRQFSAYTPTELAGDQFGSGVQIDLLGSEISRSYSGFGQATFNITADTGITAGVRYTRDNLEGSGATNVAAYDTLTPGTLISAGHRFDMVSWRGALNHHFTDDVMGYLSVSRGFKSGVYNLQPFDGQVVNPESLTAYEVGTKLEMLDRRLELNAAGFWYEIANPQVERDTGAGVSLQNADSARSRGIDLDGQAKIASNLTARFGAVFLDARYKSFRDAIFYVPTSLPPYGNLANPVVGDASGNRMPRAPSVTFNVGASYSLDLPVGKLLFDTNYYYAGAQYFNPDDEEREPGYGLLDVQVGYRPPKGNIQISIFGKNLTNRGYFTSVFETAGPVGNVGAPGAPRTYGVKLDVSL